MKKVHLACGDVYIEGHENCDIAGQLVSRGKLYGTQGEELEGNPNTTTLDKYFKFPFESDSSKRVRRPFILDREMNILQVWPWKDGTVDEIVSVSCFEHFEHSDEIPHIINEAHRVLKPGGVWKFDFPDIKRTMDEYYEAAPEFCMELIYCNHKNKYSIHNWGYTTKTISRYLTPDKWSLEFKDVVQHDYPMQGVWATKL